MHSLGGHGFGAAVHVWRRQLSSRCCRAVCGTCEGPVTFKRRSCWHWVASCPFFVPLRRGFRSVHHGLVPGQRPLSEAPWMAQERREQCTCMCSLWWGQAPAFCVGRCASCRVLCAIARPVLQRLLQILATDEVEAGPLFASLYALCDLGCAISSLAKLRFPSAAMPPCTL